jgi:hypothetical protein
VGSRAVLDAVVRRKIPSTRGESNPRNPIVQPVAQRYTDWAITALVRMGEMRKAYRILVEDPKGKDKLEDLDIDGRIILVWIFEKLGRKFWNGFIWLRTGNSSGFL